MANSLFSQEFINYFSTEFNSEDFHSAQQIWAIETAKYNTVLAANNNGIIEYDGKEWKSHTVNNFSRVRVLKYNGLNKVYVGAIDEIGYLEYNQDNNLVYISLNDLLINISDFGEVWKIEIINDEVYFQTDNYIFIYNGIKFSIIESPNSNFYLSFLIKDQIFVQVIEEGLYEISDEKLKFIEGSEVFKNSEIYFMIPYFNDILIGTLYSGIYLYSDTKTDKFTKPKIFQELNSQIKDKGICCGEIIDDNRFAIGTLNGGIFIVNISGKIINNFNYNSVNQQSIITLNLKKDNFNNLWIATNKGFYYLELGSALSEFSHNFEISGNIFSVKSDNNGIYIGTGLGAYYYADNIFSKIEGINNQVWCFGLFKNKNNKPLTDSIINLAGASDGLYILKENISKKTIDLQSIYTSNG